MIETPQTFAPEQLKYKLVDDPAHPKLKRVVALRDIPRHGVKAGDVGGLVESEYNLCQLGDAWIADNAQATEGSFIGGCAWVGDNARIDHRSKVRERARVGGHARVSRWAQMRGDAHICGLVFVSGRTVLGGDAHYRRGERFEGSLVLTGTRYPRRVAPSWGGLQWQM